MLGAPGYARRDALRRRLDLAQLGTPARRPCSKLGRFVRSASQVGRGQRDAVPPCVGNHRS